ncbi:hypothetical protein ABKN59_005006 [Abortiporus biennis]
MVIWVCKAYGRSKIIRLLGLTSVWKPRECRLVWQMNISRFIRGFTEFILDSDGSRNRIHRGTMNIRDPVHASSQDILVAIHRSNYCIMHMVDAGCSSIMSLCDLDPVWRFWYCTPGASRRRKLLTRHTQEGELCHIRKLASWSFRMEVRVANRASYACHWPITSREYPSSLRTMHRLTDFQ